MSAWSNTSGRQVLAVFVAFLKLGFTAFGGPVAHLGYFHKEFVERQRWLSESQFSQLLAICQFLPGPASSQLGFAIGLQRAGWLGATAAFFAFTAPSALVLFGLALFLPLVPVTIAAPVIQGLKLVACAVVADAVISMAKKLCPDFYRRAIAVVVAAILLAFSFSWLQFLVIAGGAIAGLVFCRDSIIPVRDQIKLGYGLRHAVVFLLLFLLVFLILAFASSGASLATLGDTFYRAGALVFGGGHVLLPLLEQPLVANGLSKETFLAGYGAAQAMPGPLFSVSAFWGALMPTGYPSWVGALVALSCVFLPGFLLLLVALPVWQSLSSNTLVARAISGVNAAVVGLLAAALYNPIFVSSVVSVFDLIAVLIALAILVVWRLSPLWVLCFCVVWSLVTPLLPAT
jgi:chromate transporter, chromate ion transporter (CHR) family